MLQKSKNLKNLLLFIKKSWKNIKKHNCFLNAKSAY